MNKYTNIATSNLYHQLKLETKAATEVEEKKKKEEIIYCYLKKLSSARVYFGGRSLKLLFREIYFREFPVSSAKSQNFLPAKFSSIKVLLFVADKS